MFLPFSIAYERAVREQRIRTEVAQAKRENQFYMENVNKAKMIRSIEERKYMKEKILKDTLSFQNNETSQPNTFTLIKRKFRQRKPINDDPDESSVQDNASLDCVLGKVFGKV